MGVSLGEREKNDTPRGLAVGRGRGCGGTWVRPSTPGNRATIAKATRPLPTTHVTLQWLNVTPFMFPPLAVLGRKEQPGLHRHF